MILRKKYRDNLIKQGKNNKISLLIGSRQVGKTTLLKELYSFFSNNKCLYLDIDIISNYEKVSTYEIFMNTLKLNGYENSQKEYFYVFLDEFQRYPSLTIILKNIYDNHSNIKIYASGSSSLTIKNQVQESLAGRKEINEIYPLDFEEFLLFKNKEKLLDNLKNLKKLKGDNISSSIKEYNELLEEFLIFGGYPEAVLMKKKEDKKKVLSSIFDLYVKKDLLEYLNIEKILDFKKLIEYISVNNGQKIKYEEITKICSLKFNDIKKYLEILSETFILKEIRPFYTNKNKELVKIPKIYFIDNGVRNYFIDNFNTLRLRNDGGYLFEGFILSELIKSNIKNINFWNDKNLEEVDFIINHKNKIIPLEVKFKDSLKKSDLSGLNNFFNLYNEINQGYLVNLSKQKKEKKINYITPYSIVDMIK